VTSILDHLAHPHQIHSFSFSELRDLASEIRRRIIDVLSTTGGHLSSNLGIVELTIALHKVFLSPADKFIFDVGHQCYTHKLLTGRNPLFPTLRQTHGLSGFTSPQESVHDHFYGGHAGNALSWSLGMAKGRDLQGASEHILPILGDAALTCGLTLEAMNQLPKNLKNFIIILNDNAMSISKNVGAIAKMLSRFFLTPHSEETLSPPRDHGPGHPKAPTQEEDFAKSPITTAPFFERFGLHYVGPIDGHDFEKLIHTLTSLRGRPYPVLVHVLTVKGKGMSHATNHPTPYHGAKPFNRKTGQFHLPSSPLPTFPKIFGHHLLTLAEKEPFLVAITPAMPVGSCLSTFMQNYPDRCIDVGIAEGHSITYSGGISFCQGTKVIVCVYSSFLHRGIDNIYHDLCIQNLPVLIAIDRAGLSGGDGVTAHGIYDIALLNVMPNIVIVQPRDGQLLRELIDSAWNWKSPVAIRYPNLHTTENHTSLRSRPLGQAEVLSEGKGIAIIALGHMCTVAFEVKEGLKKHGLDPIIVDPIFIKPLDSNLLNHIFPCIHTVITIEEHAPHGGLGSILNHFIVEHHYSHLRVFNFALPDHLIPHGVYSDLLQKVGLSSQAILDKVLHEIKPLKTAL